MPVIVERKVGGKDCRIWRHEQSSIPGAYPDVHSIEGTIVTTQGDGIPLLARGRPLCTSSGINLNELGPFQIGDVIRITVEKIGEVVS